MLFEKTLESLRIPLSIVCCKQSDNKIEITDRKVFTPELLKLLGWHKYPFDFTPRWWTDNIHPEDVSIVNIQISKLFNNESSQLELEYRFKTQENTYIWINQTIIILSKNTDEIEIFNLWNNISAEKENNDLFNIINSNPHVGLLIYKKKIVYANQALIDFTEYSTSELYELPITALIHTMAKREIENLSQDRLKTNQLPQQFNQIPIITKSGKLNFINTYSNTILYKGSNAVFIICTDATQQKKMELFKDFLIEINRIIANEKSEEQLFDRILSYIVQKPFISSVFVGKINDNDHFSPCRAKNIVQGDIQLINFEPSDFNLTNDQISAINFDSNLLKINKTISDDPFHNHILQHTDKNYDPSIFSSCQIPFQINGKTQYILTIYSHIISFFDNEIIEILEKIKYDIEFALDRIEKDKNRNIIYHALENSKDWVLITDIKGTITYVNDAVCEISGFSKNELIGNTPSAIKSGMYSKDFYKNMWETIHSGKMYSGLLTNKKKDNSFYQLDHTISPVFDHDTITHFVSVAKDVTKELYLEKEINNFKYKDSLTGLNNRNGFFINAHAESGKYIGIKPITMIIIVDILNFSHLNNVYGDQICNNILLFMKDKLKNHIFDEDVIGRTGSDEFSIFLRLKAHNEIIHIIRKTLDLFNEPFTENDTSIKISINIGAITFESQANRKDSSIKNYFNMALSALSMAKKAGENTFRFYNDEMNSSVVEELNRRDLIKEALSNKWFVLYLQPYYRTEDASIAGFEALLRIDHPKKGIIYPGEFIDTLEDSAVLPQVEEWIINTSTELVKKLQMKSDKLAISINISAKSFKDESIIKMLSNNIASNKINIEITERLFVGDLSEANNILQEINSMGYQISIDDFGTGYSSLSYLYKLTVDRIKIDISFVRNIVKSKRQYAVVKNMINLCHELGLETLAEGVETKEQYEILKSLGCNFIQGFYFSKAVPFDNAITLLNEASDKELLFKTI